MVYNPLILITIIDNVKIISLERHVFNSKGRRDISGEILCKTLMHTSIGYKNFQKLQ